MWLNSSISVLFVYQNSRARCGYIPAQVIQHSHVCIHIVEVVRVRWVVLFYPVLWQRTVQIKDMLLRFRLIIHAIEAHDLWGQEQTGLESETWKPLKVWLHVRWYKRTRTQQRWRTCCRKRCNSGWLLGLTVTSNSGMKMFSSISWKLHSCFFVW